MNRYMFSLLVKGPANRCRLIQGVIITNIILGSLLLFYTNKDTRNAVRRFSHVSSGISTIWSNAPSPSTNDAQAYDPITSHISSDVEHINNKRQYGTAATSKNDNLVVKGQTEIQNRFLARRQQIKEFCRKPSSTIPKLFLKVLPFRTFQNGRVRWCQTYKAASSFIYNLFTNGVKLKTSLKPTRRTRCMMVRDPYSRLVSGYIDKFVTGVFWSSFGTDIIKRFRSSSKYTETGMATATGHDARQSGEACGHDVTFPEFIKYFIRSQETGWLINWHFTPMSYNCDPCKTDYEYVAHVETMDEDLPYILNELGLERSHHEPNRTSGVSIIPGAMKAKIHRQLRREMDVTKCIIAMCDHLKAIWWSFQIRSYVPRDSPFPLSQAQCDAYKDDNEAMASLFSDLSVKVHRQNVERIDTKKERRKTMVDLFLQLPLETRLKVRNLLARDFELFGFNPQPDDIFPELVKG